jgi:exopolyphosphatase/guanosine-5'-triphosphate,3'-diphosphate pyrophosphatase
LILAAIDIGSNAARLLICDVEVRGKETIFNRLNIVRIPLRLGIDVFEKGFIGSKKKKMLIDTIKAYKQLMKVYDVEHYMACATSAMRDAENAKEIIKEIALETSIEIEIITGDLEAEIIYETHFAELLDNDKSYLYIDVGGGSTELTLYHKSKVVLRKSLNIGTVRLLTNKVKESVWEEMKETLKDISKKYGEFTGIGSGGNINKVISLIGTKNGFALNTDHVKDIFKEISQLSVEERMEKYNIKKDRAEVIVPALEIYTSIFKWGNINEIFVPKIGLADGLIRHLYDQIQNEN